MNSSNENLNISDHVRPFIPNSPQDIILPSAPRAQSQEQVQHQQGQLVVIPAPDEQVVGMKDGGYGDPENDFTYVNVTEIDADEEGPLLEGEDQTLTQNQMKGDVLTVLLGEMQQGKSSSLLVRLSCENFLQLFL